MKMIPVSASRAYEVRIERGLLARAGEEIGAVCNAAVAVIVSDDTVFSLYGKCLSDSLKSAGYAVLQFVFPHGESSKTLATYAELLNFLAQNHISRTDVLVALGGGVVGDLCGFAASTYLRGVSFVQIPTTLLACVDSSVGGKTAVDLPAGKNLVGCFYQPCVVLCDPDTLKTLPEDIYRDGCAEVLKYAVLGDAEFFRSLLACPASEQLEAVIETCVKMKRDIVCEDEFDRGRRQFLNLGHSFGHAVEACSDFSISHGSAVAIGMAMIARAAAEKGFCTQDTADAVCTALAQYKLPTQCPYSAEMLLPALVSDKKISSGSINLIVPATIGHCQIVRTPLADLSDWLKAGGAQ